MLRIYQNTIFATFIAVPNPKTINPSWRRLLSRNASRVTQYIQLQSLHPIAHSCSFTLTFHSDRFQIDWSIPDRFIDRFQIDSRSIDWFQIDWLQIDRSFLFHVVRILGLPVVPKLRGPELLFSQWDGEL